MANVRKYIQKSVQMARAIFRSSHLLVIDNRNRINDSEQKQSREHESRQNTAIFEQQLEGSFACHSSSILLSNKDISRRNNRGAVWDKETSERANQRTKTSTIEKGWRIKVPVQTLNINSYIYFTWDLHRRDYISFYVESEYPINTSIVDEAGFQSFQNGSD